MSDDLNPSSESGSPRLVNLKLSVPEGLLEQALRIAEFEKWKPAEFHRMLWVRGLASYCEGSNTILLNEKLRMELQERIDQAEAGDSD